MIFVMNGMYASRDLGGLISGDDNDDQSGNLRKFLQHCV
jgi:hypothetical protein